MSASRKPRDRDGRRRIAVRIGTAHSAAGTPAGKDETVHDCSIRRPSRLRHFIYRFGANLAGAAAPHGGRSTFVPILVTITGPIAAGKNTVADLLAEYCLSANRTAVVADVDDVADMVRAAGGAGAVGLWFAAHQAHGALVGQWMRSAVDVVIAVGPIYDRAERDALFGQLPPDARPCRVVIDAPLRVTADTHRGLSRQRAFHESAHARYRSLLPDIPADLTFDSANASAADIATAIFETIGIAR